MTTTDTPCWLGLGQYLGSSTMTFGEAAAVMLRHAAPLIADDAATDPRAASDLATAREVLARPVTVTAGGMGMVTATVAETASLYRAVALGCEYAANNGYADDADFPEDAAAARMLPTAAPLLLCFAHAGQARIGVCATPEHTA